MRITSTDIDALLFLTKRVFTGLLVGGKYIIVGNVGSTNMSTNASADTKAVDIKRTSQSKRSVRQLPPLVINDDIYEVPAIQRLCKVNLEEWEAKNLKPCSINVLIKDHFEQLSAKGLKPSSTYFDV